LLAGAAMLAVAVGCGSSQPTVAGKVMLDGQPLASGTIRFVPSDGTSTTAGGPIKDGAYSLEMPPGKKRVEISAMKVIGKRQVYRGDPKSPVVDDVREMIAPEYNASSTLTADVVKGSNKQDFSVKSAP
jgi:hypothetical protein